MARRAQAQLTPDMKQAATIAQEMGQGALVPLRPEWALGALVPLRSG